MALDGFRYASGGYSTEQSIPASALSKGDLLTYTSTSSLSRINELMPSGADIAGIALCDSTQSIDNKVPYLVPEADTLFWASVASNFGSNLTPGFECDVAFAVANGRYYVAPGSTSSVRVALVRGNADIDQSIKSQVLCKLIYHAGNLDLS